jgi:DNA-binding LacI/PurR family transcriptional regulator
VRGNRNLAQKIKLSTIAEALGLSTATVSLALRDSPLVADVTRDRIKEKAIELGYIYNRRAASLRTSRSGIIGVVVHDIMNPFYAEILKAIETELDRSRQTFILSNHYDSVDKQRNFIETLLQLGGDGVIMSPAIGTPASDIRLAEDNGMPAILIARSVPEIDVPTFPWRRCLWNCACDQSSYQSRTYAHRHDRRYGSHFDRPGPLCGICQCAEKGGHRS